MNKGRPILSDFGPESTSRTMGTNRATCGGVTEAKPTTYHQPVGPKHQFNPGPGERGGVNHGCCGTQGKH